MSCVVPSGRVVVLTYSLFTTTCTSTGPSGQATWTSGGVGNGSHPSPLAQAPVGTSKTKATTRLAMTDRLMAWLLSSSRIFSPYAWDALSVGIGGNHREVTRVRRC